MSLELLIVIGVTLVLVYWFNCYRNFRTTSRIMVDRRTHKRKGAYGFIYFYQIRFLFLPVIKIGRATTVEERLKAQRTSLPFGMTVKGVVMVRNAVMAETYVHTKFKKLRIYNDRKNEWFWYSPKLWLFLTA